METSSPPLPVAAPLARLKWEEVDYLSFLRDYALPRVPCIIEGVGEDWPASSKWCSLDYFLSHAGVNLEQEVCARLFTCALARSPKIRQTVMISYRHLRIRSIGPFARPFGWQ